MLRRTTATVAVALTALFCAQSATAAPIDVNVRVEGVHATIFDGVVRSDGRIVRSSSDDEPRRCDSTNNGMHELPGATPTGATVDAMDVLGYDFDGQWYPGFDDYFVKRFGPESEGPTFWWGILVNGTFTPVGGCQYALAAGDRVLWVNDAFSGRPFLWLGAPNASSRPTVTVGQPLTVDVTATETSTDQDQTSGPPYEGATVGAVTERGAQAPAGVATAGRSGADGAATVTFHAAGWQRLKARTFSDDPEVSPAAIASNSIDVCVEATAGAGCAGDPPSAWPANVARPDPEPEPRGPDPQPQPTDPQPQPVVPGPQPQPQTPPVRVTPPTPVRGGSLSWRLARDRAAIRAWRGVPAPIDDRARAIGRSGRWNAVNSAAAWRRTLSRGSAGASLRVKLAAGQPVVLLRGGAAAKVELRSGGTARTITLQRTGANATRALLGSARAQAGTVELRVLRGTVSVDGVGVRP
ncbi:hypothetical protein Q5424_28105 [Conexibacter sp. JD483]|uniref:hypothetical protein n=1 Tax=unclassified Conexibacter TaxID=2627773 RepID=UPI0027192BDA|nr:MULTISPECIES: hypothetical protein [unclassified Conexibacter]MDO8189572.1 hypothetical protein [Conexibacter sp. CPCC 205706]MDO8201076.1 hypothetical protein [Conexibacter sp. CPCC 205762]MDR9372993.1 hypothetical protein [Conexibacter sp. JD483]